MKECAIVLNGSDVIKVLNLKRKYNKIINNPNMKILKECDKDEIDSLYDSFKVKKVEEGKEDIKVINNLYYTIPNTNMWGSTPIDIYNFKKENWVLSSKEEYLKWINN